MKQPDFSDSHVLVVGDVMLDIYVNGATSRISPEAPVPVVRVTDEDARCGGAGNVALNVAALGAGSTLVGLVGADAAADRMQALLSAQGVHCALERVAGVRTITKHRVMSRNQQLIRLDFEDAFPPRAGDALEPRFGAALLQGVGTVVLSDYDKGTLCGSAALIRLARERGIPVVVDPKGADFERYRGATVITPNTAEFEAVVGHCGSEGELVARGERLRDSLDLDALLVTRSERGMTLLAKGRPPLHLPTRAQEVYDVTGAGDTVVAVLGACLAAQLPLADAVALSNIAAGVVVAKVGTATVTPVELRAALRAAAAETLRRGIHDEEALMAQVELARGRAERLVMTNGCFDILHPGHVDYLERARALGDRLIVAVNDDASVQRLKGPARPINALATRQRMLSALACVDWVVPFADDTPERLIRRVLPDVLVKGGDYKEDEIAGADAVRAAGGSVRVLDFVPGHSTTQMIRRIVENAS